MDTYIYLIILGIVLFIVETFVGTMDLLAIGIASFLTAIFLYFFPAYNTAWVIVGIVFLLASVICIYMMRAFFMKNMSKGGSTLTANDQLIGEQIVVSEVNGKIVLRYEGNFWNTSYEDTNIVAGDTVEVLGFDHNKFYISKVSDTVAHE